MRILFTVIMLLNYAFAKADTAPSYDKECIYVIAKNGLNMRDAAGPDGNVITKLPYGTKLDWSPPGSNDTKSYVWDNGQKLEGYWVKVWKSVPYEDLKGNIGGYVFSAYLSYHLEELPVSALYLFDSFYLMDNDYLELYQANYQVDEETYNYSAYIDCYPRYQEHVEPLNVIDNTASPYGKDAMAFLKSKIKIEPISRQRLVNITQPVNPYEIDESDKPTYDYIEGSAQDGGWFRFDLPLKNGTVKTIEAVRGEFSYNYDYVGKMEHQNMYIIRENFEGMVYFGIDMTTGAKTEAPVNISPQGDYAVQHDNQYLEAGALLQIKYLNNNLSVNQYLNIEFQSWVVDEDLNSSFWISDNELILKVHPIDSSVTGTYYDDRKEEHSWQYLKLTIL